MRQRSAVEADIRAARIVVAWDVLIEAMPAKLEVGVELRERAEGWGVGVVNALLRSTGGERLVLSESASAQVTSGELAFCIRDAETGLMHIDIPGVLSLSVRGELKVGSSLEVVYARTRALEQVGVLGGRYEVAGASVQRAIPAEPCD